ncbi:MAG: hypothetical protein M3068_03545 [Gemmatimonadota bacterium]|nr:hypothetical protein [Gemmatimonadota bacterium]
MRSRLASLSAAAFMLLVAGPVTARAQAVLGIGDDALVLPRGALRLRFIHAVTRFDQRYGMNTPYRANGSLEPLAVDFNLDTIGIGAFESLVPLEAGLRQVAGIPDFSLSLGKTVLGLNAKVRAVPLVAELGVTKHFSLGISVPFIRTENNAFFAVNPAGREGNVGFNPYLASAAVRSADSLLLAQFSSAATQLQGKISACTAAPATPGCSAVLANGPALLQNAQQFAGGIAQIYTSAQSVFVPVAGTDIASTINARVAAFNGLYRQFGITSITSTGPVAAQNVLGLADAQRILTDPAFGVSADPLQTVTRTGIGDIEVAGKYQFLNTLGDRDRVDPPAGLSFRSAVTGVIRFASGNVDSPENFIDIGTGSGAPGFGVRSQSDVLFGYHFWASFVGRYVWQRADHQTVRIEHSNLPLAPLYRQENVARNLGDFYELEATPRIVVNDWFGISGQYLYRHKFEDRYTGTFTVKNLARADTTLNASSLNEETEQREHRLTGGLVFSTVAPFTKGKIGIPLELSYQHSESVRGSGGRTPRLYQDVIQFRIYARLFGGDSK